MYTSCISTPSLSLFCINSSNLNISCTIKITCIICIRKKLNRLYLNVTLIFLVTRVLRVSTNLVQNINLLKLQLVVRSKIQRRKKDNKYKTIQTNDRLKIGDHEISSFRAFTTEKIQ